MRILGIADGQTSGAAVIEDGRILAAVNEERIARIKMARGFPWQSISEVLRLSGTAPRDVGAVAVAQIDMEFREEVDGWPGWFEARESDRNLHSAFFKIASRFGGLAGRLPGLKRGYYALRAPVYARRRRRIEAILREELDVTAPVRFVHHHRAHAASAYATCNMAEALVVTMDGGGDGHSSHVYSVRDGRYELLNEVDSYDSLGNYYAYVTALCGFKAKRHEGKITGLAARGEPRYRQIFDRFIGHDDGRTVNRGRVLFGAAMRRLEEELGNGWTREDVAATIQQLAEDVARDYVRHWCRKTGHRNVALAGGLFANVRINEEVHGIEGVERTFVHPGMTDEGLAVGAALAVDADARVEEGRPWTPHELSDVYLGNAYGEREIAEALEQAGLSARHMPGEIEEAVAERLAEGRVVARFAGAMEYGPRALGNRSILYQPGDPSVNDWLNELLRRTEFMPFAPSALWDAADRLFVNVDGGRDTARFMTITFHCTPFMIDRCAGVVHVDDTARPQLVRREDNPSYHAIIEAYERRTGIPAIINTSFNIHEEPIVRTPRDAVRAFLDSKLDFLAIGDFLLEGPAGSTATRAKWAGRSKWARRATTVGD